MLGCSRRHRRAIEASAEEYADKYDEVMVSDLLERLEDELTGMDVDSIDEDLMEEIWIAWKENLPDRGEWAYDEAVNDCIDAEEAKYDQWKDEQMERSFE